ncbi:MAG: DUF4184 family protein [Candidatus Thorarchaeota archaeon]|nr:DUF4184 family protein [Candidatus Thorarchaeota archaeon]
MTPLHYPVAYGISRVTRLPLPGLVVGAVMPDIEVLFLRLFFAGIVPDHFILHSLIGGLTLGTVLAVFSVRFIYAPLISTFFGVDRTRASSACKVTPLLVVSCLVGVLSHIAVDVTMHWYNPVLWPWVDPYAVIGPFVLLFASLGSINGPAFEAANMLVSVPLAVWGLVILMTNRGPMLWEHIWLGPSSTAGEPIQLPETA